MKIDGEKELGAFNFTHINHRSRYTLEVIFLLSEISVKSKWIE